jgi:membrane-associated phospholipid phosphatase
VVAIVGSYVVLAIAMASAGLVLFHVLAHGSIGSFDRRVSTWFVVHGSRTWNSVSAVATFIGGEVVLVAAIVVVVTGLLLFRRWGRRSFLLLVAMIIELSVFLSANAIVRRPRPTIRHLGVTPATFSYPSGHTAVAVVLYGGIAVLVGVATKRLWPRIAAGVIAVLIILAVGLSRIYRGDHFLTDVVAGLVMGALALYAAVLVTRAMGAAGAVRHGDEEKGSSSEVKHADGEPHQ